MGNDTEYLTKERVEKGVRRETYVRNRNENWRHDMTTYYRGVKVNSDNSSSSKASKAGIYRGVKHDGQNKKSAKTPGIYRGVETAA